MIIVKLSKPQQRIVDYLTTNTGSFHLRGLADALHVDPGNLSRDMKHLVENNLVARHMIGNQAHFSIAQGESSTIPIGITLGDKNVGLNKLSLTFQVNGKPYTLDVALSSA